MVPQRFLVAMEAQGQRNLRSVRATVRELRDMTVAGCQGPVESREAAALPRARHLVLIRPHLLSAIWSLPFSLLWVALVKKKKKKIHWKSEILQILTQISVYLFDFSKLCLNSDGSQGAGFTSFKCKRINSSSWHWKLLRQMRCFTETSARPWRHPSECPWRVFKEQVLGSICYINEPEPKRMAADCILFSFAVLSAFSEHRFGSNKLGCFILFPGLCLNTARVSVPGCLHSHMHRLVISKHRNAGLVGVISWGNRLSSWGILWILCAPLFLPQKSWDDVPGVHDSVPRSFHRLYSVRLSYIPPACIEHLLSSQTCAGSYVSLPPGCLLPDLVDRINTKHQYSSWTLKYSGALSSSRSQNRDTQKRWEGWKKE